MARKISEQESKGNRAFRKKKYKRALLAYLRALKSSPKPTSGMYARAAVSAHNAHVEEANALPDEANDYAKDEWAKIVKLSNELLEEGHKLYPNDIDICKARCVFLQDADSASDYIEACRIFLKMMPHDYELKKTTLESVAGSLLFLGEYDLFGAYVEKYLEHNDACETVDPKYPRLAHWIGAVGEIFVTEDRVDSFGRFLLTPDHYEFPINECGLPPSSHYDDIAGLPTYENKHINTFVLLLKMLACNQQNEHEKVKNIAQSFDPAIHNESTPDLIKARLSDFHYLDETIYDDPYEIDYDVIEQERNQRKESYTDVYDEFIRCMIDKDYETLQDRESIVYKTTPWNLPSYTPTKEMWREIVSLCGQQRFTEATCRVKNAIRREKPYNWPSAMYKVLLETQLLAALEAEEWNDAKSAATHLRKFKPVNSKIIARQAYALHYDPVRVQREKEKEIRAQQNSILSSRKLFLESIPKNSHEIQGYAKKFVDHPARLTEQEDIARFLYCNFQIAIDFLSQTNYEIGLCKVIAMLNEKRSETRKRIPKDQFDQVWPVVKILREILNVISGEELLKCSEECLESGETFHIKLSQILLEKNWQETQKLVKAYRDFLFWELGEQLGFAKKKKNKAKNKKRKKKKHVAGKQTKETCAQANIPWKLFYVRNGHDAEIPNEVNEFEKITDKRWIISAHQLHSKINLILQCDALQMARFPRKVFSEEEDYRNIRIANTYLFWKMDREKRVLSFFVRHQNEINL